jgi:hypothetical protein
MNPNNNVDDNNNNNNDRDNGDDDDEDFDHQDRETVRIYEPPDIWFLVSYFFFEFIQKTENKETDKSTNYLINYEAWRRWRWRRWWRWQQQQQQWWRLQRK